MPLLCQTKKFFHFIFQQRFPNSFSSLTVVLDSMFWGETLKAVKSERVNIVSSSHFWKSQDQTTDLKLDQKGQHFDFDLFLRTLLTLFFKMKTFIQPNSGVWTLSCNSAYLEARNVENKHAWIWQYIQASKTIKLIFISSCDLWIYRWFKCLSWIKSTNINDHSHSKNKEKTLTREQGVTISDSMPVRAL